MRDTSELHEMVTGTLKDNIRASVLKGLGNFTLNVENAEHLADRVANAARDSGALDEMFGRFVKAWILRNRDKAARILGEAKEDENG